MNDLKHSIDLASVGQLAEAVEETRIQISKHPNNGYLNYWLGILLYDMHDYEGACAAFKRELEIDPRSRNAAWELGSAYSRLGRVEETINAYQKALDIDPCCAQALFGMGNVNLRIGDYLEAVEYYKDLLSLRSDLDKSDLRAGKEHVKSFTVQIHYNLGYAYMRVNSVDEAKECFETVLRLGRGGRLTELASQNLQLLSDPSTRLDSIVWSSAELPPEEL